MYLVDLSVTHTDSVHQEENRRTWSTNDTEWDQCANFRVYGRMALSNFDQLVAQAILL